MTFKRSVSADPREPLFHVMKADDVHNFIVYKTEVVCTLCLKAMFHHFLPRVVKGFSMTRELAIFFFMKREIKNLIYVNRNQGLFCNS